MRLHARFGIRLQEIGVFKEQMGFTMEDPDVRDEARFVTLGSDALGRVLVVVHTQRGERTRMISARKASRGEADRYHA